jgi:Tellurite resistance protein TerB
MIVIFGFRVRLKTIAEGTFFCPRCGADRSYLLQQARRWFTLFFIPIFPASQPLGDQVQCTTCRTSFRPEVLDAPTSEEFSENLRGAMRVAAIAMLHASDPHHAAARQAAIAATRETGLEHYEDAWLTNDLEAIDTSTLDSYVRALAQGLNDQGKETFLAQVARVGLADGPLTPPETQLLDSIGSALGLSAAHVRGILVTTVESPAPGETPS